jgi:hypothetical protein
VCIALQGRKAAVAQAGTAGGRLRLCPRAGCREVYCCAACLQQNADTHALLCTGRPAAAVEGAGAGAGPCSARGIHDFTKHALESNELFLMAARLMAALIAAAHAVAKAGDSQGSEAGTDAERTAAITALFERELSRLLEEYLARFPSRLGGHAQGAPSKRRRGEAEAPAGGGEAAAEDGLAALMHQQAEESWLLFRAAVLYGAGGGWAGPLLEGAQCNLSLSSARGGETYREFCFSEAVWLQLVASIQFHVMPVTLASAMTAPIRDAIRTADKAERWKKAEPFLKIFFPLDKHDPLAGAEAKVERKIAQLAQLGQGQGQAGGAAQQGIFDVHSAHHLVLLPALRAAYPHSCLPSAALDVVLAGQQGSGPGPAPPAAPASDSPFQPPAACLYASDIRVNLVAVRDIERGGGGVEGEGKGGVTVSRFQLRTSSSLDSDDISGGEAGAGSLRALYAARQAALCAMQRRERGDSSGGSSEDSAYACPCVLCAWEREFCVASSASDNADVDLSYLDEVLNDCYSRQQQGQGQGGDMSPLPPPVLPAPRAPGGATGGGSLGVGPALLLAVGQRYMQTGRFRPAAQAYFALVALRHRQHHEQRARALALGGPGPAFDASAYFHLGSALLDAGRSKAACNAWALGYGMDPGNAWLRTQRHKDTAFLYTTILSSAAPLPGRAGGGSGPRQLMNSSVCSDMIRNFKLFHSEGEKEISAFDAELSSIYKSLDVEVDILSHLDSYGLGIYGTRPSFAALTPAECESIIEQAHAYVDQEVEAEAGDGAVTRGPRGWTTTRHYDAPTTDVPVHVVPGALRLFNGCALRRLGPMLHAVLRRDRRGEDAKQYMYINDAFIVKYEVTGDASKTSQRYLPMHLDQSHYSFTIALNSAAEYDGGGTYFAALDRALSADKGHCLLFPGTLRHGGDPITRGVRYILAVFVFLSSEPSVDGKSPVSSTQQEAAGSMVNVFHRAGAAASASASAEPCPGGEDKKEPSFSFGFSNF